MIKREQPALPSPSLPSHPICVHSSPHPVPGSQEQLEPTVCTEQGLSSAWNTIHCFLRLFLMCYKDCHPITSPPIERMIRKINNNNLCVLSNFLVPGTVLAKHYLWTSQQPFLNSPSHTQRNQPSLGFPRSPAGDIQACIPAPAGLHPRGTSSLPCWAVPEAVTAVAIYSVPTVNQMLYFFLIQQNGEVSIRYLHLISIK